MPHGVAVSLGVACATFFSERLGMAETGEFSRLREWLRPLFCGHEQTVRAADAQALLSAMQLDKKNRGEGITFILTRGAGRMEKRGLAVGETRTLLAACLAEL